jgi:hypothetical protein
MVVLVWFFLCCDSLNFFLSSLDLFSRHQFWISTSSMGDVTIQKLGCEEKIQKSNYVQFLLACTVDLIVGINYISPSILAQLKTSMDQKNCNKLLELMVILYCWNFEKKIVPLLPLVNCVLVCRSNRSIDRFKPIETEEKKQWIVLCIV